MTFQRGGGGGGFSLTTMGFYMNKFHYPIIIVKASTMYTRQRRQTCASFWLFPKLYNVKQDFRKYTNLTLIATSSSLVEMLPFYLLTLYLVLKTDKIVSVYSDDVKSVGR